MAAEESTVNGQVSTASELAASALASRSGGERILAALRALWRIPALVLVTTVLYLIWTLTKLLGGLRTSVGRSAHFALMHLWGRSCARIMGVRTEVQGEAPKGSFLLLSNHLSYVDILVLLGRADAVFVAKSEIATWPVMGFLARTTGTIFVDRERRRDLTSVNRVIGEAFDRGYGVVLFPEGTSGRGDSVLPFKPSIFEVAFREPNPDVYVASLAYFTPEKSPPADLSVCWWGDMGFFGHFLGALGLPSVRVILTFSGDKLLAANRKELAQRAHRAVSEIFTPSFRPGCARE